MLLPCNTWTFHYFMSEQAIPNNLHLLAKVPGKIAGKGESNSRGYCGSRRRAA